jgi:hypothetical protein
MTMTATTRAAQAHAELLPRFAAPAPADAEEQDADAQQLAEASELHAVCESWSSWCRTRRFFGRPAMPASLLVKLTSRTRPLSPGGPDAACSAQLSAFHLAVLGQPATALDRQVFELHYLWRVRNVKAAAAAVGISRTHWYRLVREFRARVYAAALEIQRDNEEQARQLGRPQAASAGQD